MIRSLSCLLSGVLSIIGVLANDLPQAEAAIIGQNSLKIDFTDPADAAEKAEWSDPRHITANRHGLGWDGNVDSSRTGWLRTKPMGVGLSWRPLTRTGIAVTIKPEAKPVSDTNIEDVGSLYVRYSPDLKNWSDWQMLSWQGKTAGKPVEEGEPPRAVSMHRTYSGQIGIARESQTLYHQMLREYSQQKVPWKSDEEAAALWILKKHPKFFEQNRPYIGHVQFLYEADFRGGRRLESLEIHMGWVVNGTHYPPDDESVYQNRDDIPWRFSAEAMQAESDK